MDRWNTWWKLIKDVALTAVGLVLILLQAISAHPSNSKLLAGLALTGIGAYFHVGELMSGYFGTPRSPRVSLAGSSPEEASGEPEAEAEEAE